MSIATKILASFRNRGVIATIQLGLSTIPWQLRFLADRMFDKRYGVRTSGMVMVAELGVRDTETKGAVHYEPSPAAAVRFMLGVPRIDHSNYTFVDFGSGKGRVLLLASLYPYRKIVGVEFSRDLHEIASENIRNWRHSKRRARDVESVCINALEYPIPDDPLVLFFYTPFMPPISTTVIARIRESLTARPRPIEVLYYGRDETFIGLLESLRLKSTVAYSRRPLAATGQYKGIHFTSE